MVIIFQSKIMKYRKVFREKVISVRTKYLHMVPNHNRTKVTQFEGHSASILSVAMDPKGNWKIFFCMKSTMNANDQWKISNMKRLIVVNIYVL